ncbi:MAG: CHAT domain-containing protein [Isosphaeraceae bacterium]|nr:CHAT domain-containing protein [Isosphaeraceae bacterium]
MNRGSVLALVIAWASILFGPNLAGRLQAQDLDQLEKQFGAAMEAGHHREAEQLARRALALSAKTRFPSALESDAALAVWNLNLGMALYTQNQYVEAEGHYKRAMAIWERYVGPEHHLVAQCLNNLAVLYFEQGRYAEAEPLYRRNLAIEEKALGPGHPDFATGLNNLALFYTAQARYADAEPLYRRALAIYERALGPEHRDVARSLNNLAKLKEEVGRYSEAEPLYKRALAIRERALGPGHQDVANSLNFLASMYEAQGRYKEAEPLLERALAINEKADGPDSMSAADCLNDLANLYFDLRLYGKAEPLVQRAIKSAEKTLGADHGALAIYLDTLGDIEYRQSRFADAAAHLNRALAIDKKAHGTETRLTAYGSWSLAQIEAKQGRVTQAKHWIDRAIAVAEKIGMSSGFRSTLHDFRASLGWQEGRRDEALTELRLAMKLADDQRGLISGGEVERAATFADYAGVYERMVQWQTELGDVGAALEAIERSRARSLLDEISLAGVDLQAGRPIAERQRLEREGAVLRERVVVLEKQLGPVESDPARKAEANRLGNELDEARRRLYEHARDARTSSPLYRDLLNHGAGPPGLDQIQRRLCGDGGVLLSYLFGHEGGYVIAVGPGRARVFALKLDDADAKALGSTPGPLTAERLQSVLIGPNGTGVVPRLADPNAASAAPSLAVLWRVLVPEAERGALVGGTTKRLTIVPDGPLAFLPFEALVVEEGKEPKYLLDAGPPVVYAPSATISLSLAERTGEPAVRDRDPVLALGDPAYSEAVAGSASDNARGLRGSRQRYVLAGGALPRLPFSGWEAEWVAKAFNDAGIKAGVFTGANATEAAVRYWTPGRKIIHLACHGLADQSLGNFYGSLALTPGPNADTNPADDGFLMLGEICELGLKGCELAILSACQTNFGPQQTGEGTWSLSRGFLVAGARRVVASNWLVDDEASASLISIACTLLAKAEKAGQPEDYAGSLREAKRWVRGHDKWRSPYFWAPLVLIGPP